MRLGALLAINVAAMLTLPSLASAEGTADSVDALVDEGFLPMAAGNLIMERQIVRPMDSGILVMGDPLCREQSEPMLMASIGGPLRDCDVSYVAVRYGKFMRMVRGAEEYVCVRDGTTKCYRVSEQETGKQ